jgi:hypothetical protein
MNSNQDTSTKKPLPVAMTKAQLVRLYSPLSEKFVRAELNNIILENRRINFPKLQNLTDEQLRQAKIVFRCEIIAFANIGYGLPDGYCLPEI